MPEVPERITLATADAEIVIDTRLGARATSWRVDGLELLTGRSDAPVEHGMYPMAPWAGRVRGNAVERSGAPVALPVTYGPWALHGTVLARAASAVEVHECGTALTAVFDAHPEWPWRSSVVITWRLTGRTLETLIEVQAIDEAFPAVVGWHPWFRRQLDRGGTARWTLPATGQLARGVDHLPTGEIEPFDPSAGPFDDAFRVPDGSARLTWPGALDLEIASDGDWYVVFDELAAALCVEPQSGPPDGLLMTERPSAYGDVRMAEPGRPLRLATRWSAQPLD